MTLTAILDSMSEFILAPLNFSSGTTPDLILKTFGQYCEIVDSPGGVRIRVWVWVRVRVRTRKVYVTNCHLR
jgi:hypothetical protein